MPKPDKNKLDENELNIINRVLIENFVGKQLGAKEIITHIPLWLSHQVLMKIHDHGYKLVKI